MSSFEKVRCAFGDVLRSLPSLHRKLARLAAVELLARNGTLPEPRLRINGTHFKTLHSIGAGKSWKISSFGKLEIKAFKFIFLLWIKFINGYIIGQISSFKRTRHLTK